ncbi:hypothetical protein ABG768_011954 [Culter alburnus]|uniref:Uncharacterized protein n=1 Tax=Culter alburnus TaxID=194366 RepID=A0AAW1ZBF0_CULAL
MKPEIRSPVDNATTHAQSWKSFDLFSFHSSSCRLTLAPPTLPPAETRAMADLRSVLPCLSRWVRLTKVRETAVPGTGSRETRAPPKSTQEFGHRGLCFEEQQ